MGLDVSVYKNVKVTEKEEEYNFSTIANLKHFENHVKNLEMGKMYKGELIYRIPSTTYSYHNLFRKELLKVIGRQDM